MENHLTMSEPEAVQRQAQLLSLRTEIKELEKWHVHQTTQTAQAEQALRALGDVTELLNDRARYTSETHIAARNNADKIKETLDKLQSTKQQLASLVSAETHWHEQLGMVQLQLEELSNQPAFELPPKSAELFNLFNDYTPALMEARNRQAQYDQAKGAYDQALRNVLMNRKAVEELEQRIAADKGKRDIIAKLHKVKELLSRNGLPGAYVNYRFGQLARLTQEYLTTINADFIVNVDPDKTLSFTFTRLDDGSVLPMTKLSGGQRARLCLSFLMAVQRALVSEVGLLVLDEPSTHVDDQGKEDLAELLSDIGRKLTNTDHQVWCCDHAPVLERAFGKLIRLT